MHITGRNPDALVPIFAPLVMLPANAVNFLLSVENCILAKQNK